MWQEILNNKEQWIGGILEEYPDPPFSESVQTLIQDIKLLEEDGETYLVFECTDFDECFNVRSGKIVIGSDGYANIVNNNPFRIKKK